jgi:hypothetical protein
VGLEVESSHSGPPGKTTPVNTPPTHNPVSVLGVTAVPLRETICGLPAALSVIVTVPVTLPVVLGTRVTLMAQFAPAASVAPQVLVSAKFAVTSMLVIDSGAVPPLVSVMSRGSLVEPTSSSPKVRLLAEKETLGDPPFPQLLSAQDPKSTAAIRTKNPDFMFSSIGGGVGRVPQSGKVGNIGSLKIGLIFSESLSR